MKDTEAVSPSAHMVSGLVQAHEDEGRSGVISASHELRGRYDDGKATEGVTTSTTPPPEDHEARRTGALKLMDTLRGLQTAIATLGWGPTGVASV